MDPGGKRPAAAGAATQDAQAGVVGASAFGASQGGAAASTAVPSGSAGAAGKEWDHPMEKKAPRGGFKISHLEDAFATNAFINNVFAIARDQAGCRMLQHKLEEGNAEIVNAIFAEVLAHIVELMMDPFGNYLCQKVMDMCNARQLELILDKACGGLVRISLNMHGARAVQKLIDVVRSTPYIPRLVAALEGAVVALTKDPNGNHVVQRCLESLPPEAHAFISRAVANEIVDVASHRHGCRIVQRCIDAAVGHDRRLLTGAICKNSLTLVQDPFGNYVVQYVLGLHDPKANSEIIACMLGRLNVLSRQKFSSNVVERCLQVSSPEDKVRMLMELADVRGLGELLRDVYGNYVVQSALGLAPEPQLSHFLGAVRPLLPSLRASGQGRRIAQKLEKKYPQLRAGAGAEASSGNVGNVGAAGRGAGSAGSTSGMPRRGGDAGGMLALHGNVASSASGGPQMRMDDALTVLGIPGMAGPTSLGSSLDAAGYANGLAAVPGPVANAAAQGQMTPAAAAASAASGRGGGRAKKGRRRDSSLGDRGGGSGGAAGKHQQ